MATTTTRDVWENCINIHIGEYQFLLWEEHLSNELTSLDFDAFIQLPQNVSRFEEYEKKLRAKPYEQIRIEEIE